MTDEAVKIAYAAGIIDGEGTINVEPRGSWMPVVNVAVQMTDIRVINHMHAEFGGNVYVVRRKAPSILPGGAVAKNPRQQYLWRLSATQTEPFLRAILPFLIVKRTQAELALALRAMVGRRGLRVTPEKLAAAESLRCRISVLNRTGSEAQ